MIRAYALAAGAGTQLFTQGIGDGAFGTGDLSKALSMTSGWIINIAVAEWVIRRPSVRRTRRAHTRAVVEQGTLSVVESYEHTFHYGK